MNGSCLNGCDAGVQGFKCDIGKLNNVILFVGFLRNKITRNRNNAFRQNNSYPYCIVKQLLTYKKKIVHSTSIDNNYDKHILFVNISTKHL